MVNAACVMCGDPVIDPMTHVCKDDTFNGRPVERLARDTGKFFTYEKWVPLPPKDEK